MRRLTLLPQERLARLYMEEPEVLKLMKSMDKRVFSDYRGLPVMEVMLDKSAAADRNMLSWTKKEN